jgi:very-short-patch-repair endonuclease
VRQVVRTDGQGKRRYLDGEIVCKSGKRVAFEVDGGVHLLPESYWNDMRRQNELLIVGTTVLRFSSYAARFQRAAVADQIRRASVA